MSESKLQSKILQWLKSEGHYTFKVITANRAGILDINGCTNWGQFFAIEVKAPKGKPSRLQLWNIDEIRKRGGIAILAYDLETVKKELVQ